MSPDEILASLDLTPEETTDFVKGARFIFEPAEGFADTDREESSVRLAPLANQPAVIRKRQE
jgi:hypothetical protein